ncbi:unnamed protein product [Zymoseptoria tritici ST99CH_1E4]|uniref:Acyltransferase MbtK/IucB-like conserved domain-containing protein n=1 Tax=Zymoseptoria tritici ST99CH_1E4 TaxID=1276532 RepID=A0A2H1G4E7_ZYMTR|nr:unnamed protein product [Zymoseptoria tritici ST99CH_1E4]
MAPSPPTIVHLPNGQSLSVSPVFGGLSFKANDLHTPHNVFPPGWTIIINSEDDEEDDSDKDDPSSERKNHIHRYKTPTLRNDHLFISSISNPSSADFRAPTSPTRQIAMMLWATLYWYFHQPAPSPHLTTPASSSTPLEGRPKGEWRININREGIFKGRQLVPKLERMGLIASEDSSVGLDPDDGVTNAHEGWTKMYVSRRAFWQMDPRIYLFTLTPMHPNSPFPALSPAGSRPSSPSRGGPRDEDRHSHSQTRNLTSNSRSATPPPGPFHSTSHLPTYYPPPPLQYTFTNNTRHPLRPKPFRQGETIYTRYIPSLDQYLSFRVASLSKRPVPYAGPYPHSHSAAGGASSTSDASLQSGRDILRSTSQEGKSQSTGPATLSDVEYLHQWHNDERVAHSWGETGPASHQEEFLRGGLQSRHSIPLIGLWDGKPFGYFEMYWVKEDRLGGYLGGDVGDFDRGLHVLVGETEFRGAHRVKVWIDALVHACWLADSRTEVVVLEPRVDNLKLKTYLEERGFYKEREITFPHKQSNLMKIRRDGWEGPAI